MLQLFAPTEAGIHQWRWRSVTIFYCAGKCAALIPSIIRSHRTNSLPPTSRALHALASADRRPRSPASRGAMARRCPQVRRNRLVIIEPTIKLVSDLDAIIVGASSCWARSLTFVIGPSRQGAALRSGLLSTRRPVIPRSIGNALIWLITPKSKGKTKDQRLRRLDQK
jgi:hypothetical protein